MKKLPKIAITATTATFLGLGALITAPLHASAVTKEDCNPPVFGKKTRTIPYTANFRTGPGKKYTSRGLLKKGTKLHVVCDKEKGMGGPLWTYGKVKSGAHKGKKGWYYDNESGPWD